MIAAFVDIHIFKCYTEKKLVNRRTILSEHQRMCKQKDKFIIWQAFAGLIKVCLNDA